MIRGDEEILRITGPVFDGIYEYCKRSMLLGRITPGRLALYPFLERWVAGDNREHHVRDRPRNAPARTAVGMAGVTFYGLLRLLGSNDLTASFLNIQLYWTTWFGRVAIFA